MDQAVTFHNDPFLAALRELPGMQLLPPALAEALLHLPSQAFDGLRAKREPVPPMITVGGQSGYLAGDLVQYVEQDPTRRGSIKIRQASFADFLIQGLPDDTWVFGMVAIDFHGMRRPVDLATCLDLPMTVLADAHVRQMTLKEYAEAMDVYLCRFDDQQAAEALAIKRTEQAGRFAPPARSKSRPVRS
jgi:hypothetical protein